MATIQFLGASSGEVTGSSYLLTLDSGAKLLIDLGLFQGLPADEHQNYLPLAFSPNILQAVFLTHAHLDHCGRLPLLVKGGYTGKIYATAATRDIAAVSLLDAAHIQMEDAAGNPLYTPDDVEKTINLFQTVDYDQPFLIGNTSIVFRDAGHILGSASIEVSLPSSQTVVFSGDLGNSPEDLIKPTETIRHASTVVIESTYGGSTHPTENVLEVLRQEVITIENSGGTLLIPAFSIERTQEILHLLSHLKVSNQIKSQTPVYLDSPMAIEVTDIFKKYPSLYNIELSKDAHPFDFPGLITTKSVDDSKNILTTPGPKIIIAGSGMLNGGRILHHLKNYISESSTRILIVGYQAIGTLGRDLEDGHKTLRIYKESLPVHATVTKLESLSSHADQPKLLSWLKAISGVAQVFVVHGEDPQRQALAQKITSELGISNVVLPTANQTIAIVPVSV